MTEDPNKRVNERGAEIFTQGGKDYLLRVNERGAEIFTQGGKDYLLRVKSANNTGITGERL